MKKNQNWAERFPFFIKKIEVEGLLTRRDIEWCLGDINVLVGKNGSGKSTLLNLVDLALNASDYEAKRSAFNNKFKSVKVTLNNGMSASSKVENGKEHESLMLQAITNALQNENNQFSTDELEKLQATLETMTSNVNSAQLHKSFLSGKADFLAFDPNTDKQVNKLLENVNLEFISTFDMLMLSKEEQDEYGGQAYSQLDVMIRKEISKLSNLILRLTNQSSREYTLSLTKDRNLTNIRDINLANVNRFVVEINKLLSPESKEVVIGDDGNIQIFYQNKLIQSDELSSGEKQLLLIFLRVLNSTNKPSIIVLDEPEISMHLSWQEKLISSLTAIHPDSQIIVVSHSPAIVMKGWLNKLIDMNEISK
ncbi:AAA family ATPase [Photobacterium sp. GB-210]|uniref:AAA family ATPase n=1 Tax=Photobacterium sp. GB-210 TaxID=2022104 RepID=UPI000D15503D|nr:ATP-binding protein [Photobacterium sp. GB-210]PSV38597.1 hypothetical protein C9J38_08995 [Photobacterium sp. GB-210]